MGLLGLPQAMLSFSQKEASPSLDAVIVFSSPIVPRTLSDNLYVPGDCDVGSGEVSQEELWPLLEAEFEDADGELYEVFWPVLFGPRSESELDLDAFELV